MKLIDKILKQMKVDEYCLRNLSKWFMCSDDCNGMCMACKWVKDTTGGDNHAGT